MTHWIGFNNMKNWFIDREQFELVKWICKEFNASQIMAIQKEQ